MTGAGGGSESFPVWHARRRHQGAGHHGQPDHGVPSDVPPEILLNAGLEQPYRTLLGRTVMFRVIGGLRPGTSSTVAVAAVTAAGTGPAATVTATTRATAL